MKKPKKKSAAKAAVQQENVEPAVSPNGGFPDWVDFEPLADFRLIAWESDEKTVEILLTSHEFIVLKDRLARMRGFALAEATHA